MRNGKPMIIALLTMLLLGCCAHQAIAQQELISNSLVEQVGGPNDWTKPERLTSTLQVMLMLTVVSLAPAILLMTTSFVRIVVVLGLLRQALGTQQLPPSQVITSIAMFVTLLLMMPVWQQSYDQGIKPYTENEISIDEAFTRSVAPMRKFMAQQIERTNNHDDVHLFLSYMPGEIDPATGELYTNYAYYEVQSDERAVPLQALLPAFMLSELKTAFLIGFQIYLPFVILDIVVASVTISMGMLMLPPVLISLPFKLLLFVLVDGWRLVIEMLLQSFQVFV
ncbi:flagellar type III secretion system pore protein FliP [Aeoliella mucimassa]|uniref:Flagellar biosynthetic protein FliP n=1 Tax=Aeoliella mucimassa TaxID=2527972 RepID=A0A518AKU2_9BACT|nr:flagellar type III secretion system pore protein FliP [Aeoliella mucimassa]QDU55304.1 Flagellar biosynthetic protein FliP precursor [Aeoliella mucimassa]